MKIEELIEIIKALGGEATIDEICKAFQKKWGMDIVSSLKVIQLYNINPNLVNLINLPRNRTWC